jgi:hypothetical protein
MMPGGGATMAQKLKDTTDVFVKLLRNYTVKPHLLSKRQLNELARSNVPVSPFDVGECCPGQPEREFAATKAFLVVLKNKEVLRWKEIQGEAKTLSEKYQPIANRSKRRPKTMRPRASHRTS